MSRSRWGANTAWCYATSAPARVDEIKATQVTTSGGKFFAVKAVCQSECVVLSGCLLSHVRRACTPRCPVDTAVHAWLLTHRFHCAARPVVTGGSKQLGAPIRGYPRIHRKEPVVFGRSDVQIAWLRGAHTVSGAGWVLTLHRSQPWRQV